MCRVHRVDENGILEAQQLCGWRLIVGQGCEVWHFTRRLLLSVLMRRRSDHPPPCDCWPSLPHLLPATAPFGVLVRCSPGAWHRRRAHASCARRPTLCAHAHEDCRFDARRSSRPAARSGRAFAMLCCVPYLSSAVRVGTVAFWCCARPCAAPRPRAEEHKLI